MQNLIKAAVVGLVLLSIVLQACGSKPESPQIAPVAPGEVALSAKPAWQQDWERTLGAAKKEGHVTIYTAYPPDWRQAFAEAMARKYSITVESVAGRNQEVIARLMSEQRNRVPNADVVLAISTSSMGTFRGPEKVLQPLEKTLVLPEVVDPKAWFRGQLTWLDPDEKSMLGYREAVTPPWIINVDLVNSGDLTSWNDLLNPKWKGKILLDDPTTSGAGQLHMTMLAYGIKDWDFIRALLKQEPDVQRDARLLVEWVARGKFPMAIAPRKDEAFQFMQAGAPIKYVIPSEGTYSSVGDGTVAQSANSPRPNAAKIFINFLLSKEGQTLAAKTSGNQSLRVDIPTDYLDPATVRQPRMKYISNVDAGFLEKQSEITKEVVRVFQAYLKR